MSKHVKTTKPAAKVLTLRERLRGEIDVQVTALHDAVAKAIGGNGQVVDSPAVVDAAYLLVKSGEWTEQQIHDLCAVRCEVDELLRRLEGGRGRLAEALELANEGVEAGRTRHRALLEKIKTEGAEALLTSHNADAQVSTWDADFRKLQVLMGASPDLMARMAHLMPAKEFARECVFECGADDSITPVWGDAPAPQPFSVISPPPPPRPVDYDAAKVLSEPMVDANFALDNQGGDLAGAEFFGDRDTGEEAF